MAQCCSEGITTGLLGENSLRAKDHVLNNFEGLNHLALNGGHVYIQCMFVKLHFKMKEL